MIGILIVKAVAMPRLETLAEFYELITATVPLRRSIVKHVLAAGSCKPGDDQRLHPCREGLRETLETLRTHQRDDGMCALLTKPGGRRTAIAVDYEIAELEKDLIFLEEGEPALRESLCDHAPGLTAEIAAVHDLLAPAAGAVFITDRDGTVNNYCGRYRSSVQSAYNAVQLTRFADARTRRALILTSAPLADHGLLSLSVQPPDRFVLAGSKGRELHDTTGERYQTPIEPAKQDKLNALNRALLDLLELHEHEEFALIGSGIQRKVGQTTVARQDIYGSIEADRSLQFLETVRELVTGLDPEGEVFRIEDTGYDIEILLTRDEGDRDFNKGDGISYVDRTVGLGLTSSVIVCGDTASDLPMVTAAASTAEDLRVVFVTEDDQLKREVERQAPQALRVTRPDALVLGLGALGWSESYESMERRHL